MPAPKPRQNQPTGYRNSYGGSPSRYYGRRHEYVYFPVAWIDPDSGRHYDGGYYDENGNRYESISYFRNGTYENVVCVCPYCDNKSIISLSAQNPNEQSLKCPVCGGAMEIRSALDEYQSAGSGYAAPAHQQKRAGTGARVFVIIAAVLIALVGLTVLGYQSRKWNSPGSPAGSTAEAPQSTGTGEPLQSIGTGEPLQSIGTDNADLPYGTAVSLADNGDGSFRIVDGTGAKTITYDPEFDSYYDPESDCYLWYNTDVEPALWQYWYEGISSDYGDYGWMEHDSEGWWIEAGYDDWIPLPDEYQSDRLWYIAD